MRTGFFPQEEIPYGKWVEVESLLPWENNPMCRNQSDLPFRELRQLLGEAGQVEPAGIIVFGNHNIVWNGNRRLRAVTELGWTHLWCVPRELHNGDDPSLLAAALSVISNSAIKPWRTQETGQLVSSMPDAMSYVPSNKRRKIARMIELLEDDYRDFFSSYGTRGYDIARRVANYLSWPEDKTRQVMNYMLDNLGVVRTIEDSMKYGIAPDRLAEVIKSGERLQPRW